MIPVLEIKDMFFWMGCYDTPKNPEGFPDTFPFTLELNERTWLLSQKNSTALSDLMDRTYAFGSTVGNAMDESDLGRAYCLDFLDFCLKNLRPGARILEIGAGRGYLASLFAQKGFVIDALEPGEINRPYWKRYGVKIIQDLFPTPKAKGPYDAIIFYGVLEHISNSAAFLKSVREHLAPDGTVLVAVPDCRLEIEAGDPSTLLHEHYHYFTSTSLARVLAENGFDASVSSSGYGRLLYATMKASSQVRPVPATEDEKRILRGYGVKCAQLREAASSRIRTHKNLAGLGIYCPARILALLSPDTRVRFFDDSEDLHNCYYPPYPNKIENRADLLANPPEELWIMSRTFGHKIKAALEQAGVKSRIYLPDDLLNEGERKAG